VYALLVPFCALLGLDRDFFVRRAEHHYTKALMSFPAVTVTATASHTTSRSAGGGSSLLSKQHPLHSVRDIIGNMKFLVRRIAGW
jgi:alkanesulfonate monooxygenase SsuD/methylene tetrahydromethanopterin reductase-like flavin-dependent oxidoreductase (luciferase family)